MRESGAQVFLADHREFVSPGMHKKAFKSQHACSRERLNLFLIALNHASPRRPIDLALTLRRVPLRLKGGHIRGRGDTIQRHVHEHGVPAGCSRACCRMKSLPLGSPRFVDVDMRIDQSGQKGCLAEVFAAGICWNFTLSDHGLDPLLLHQHSPGPDSLRRNNPAREKSLQAHHLPQSKLFEKRTWRIKAIPKFHTLQC